MIKKKATNPTILESPDLVSFISLKEGIQPKPFVRGSDGRVCFEFSDDVAGSISAFYANEAVPIADYCQKLKMIRSMIFAMKGGGADWEKVEMVDSRHLLPLRGIS